MEIIKVIVNPQAGNGKSREIGLNFENFLCSLGIQYNVDYTFKPSAANLIAKQCVEKGYKNIVAIGGDGTINEIVNAIVGTDITLSVIPAGNNNNFAKTLGLRIENNYMKEIFELAINGKPILSDVGKINNRYFINSISLDRESDNQKSSLKKEKYIFNLLNPIKDFENPTITIKTRNISFHSKINATKILNGKYFGDKFYFSPMSSINDGHLDICVYKYLDKFNFLRNLKNYKQPFHLIRTKNLTIESNKNIKAICDGEILEEKLPFEICISTKKIKVKTK